MEATQITEPTGELAKAVERVCETREPITFKTPDGKTARLMPVPQPIRYHKGRSVYRAEDTKFLCGEFPWLLE